MSKKNLFILAGNGPYDNRGCEAIVRGTTQIIRGCFDQASFLVVGNFQQGNQFQKQVENEIDPAIVHLKTFRAKERTPLWLYQGVLRRLALSYWGRMVYEDMLPYLKDARAVLSVGGDNYSFDYGVPYLFTALDDLVLSYKKPLIIWGASVGPFDKMPKYEKYIINHLKKVTAIFVRETTSLEYLAEHGIRDNVSLVADSAFLLKPKMPKEVQCIEEGAVGINLSPLMAKYITDGNLKKWIVLSAQIIRCVHDLTKRVIYLIPHVTSPHTNDYCFLKEVHSLLDRGNIILVQDKFDAAETKWIISRMAAFAGARTHSTIAALSSGVPTLSFVYSTKSLGINRDIFGHTDYCILPNECEPMIVANKIKFLLDEADQIKKELECQISKILHLAVFSAIQLKRLLN